MFRSASIDVDLSHTWLNDCINILGGFGQQWICHGTIKNREPLFEHLSSTPWLPGCNISLEVGEDDIVDGQGGWGAFVLLREASRHV